MEKERKETVTYTMVSSSNPLPKFIEREEDGLTQECKELLLSLPKVVGGIPSNLYQYQGFWHTPNQLQGTLRCQKHFQAHDIDILLVTTLKSGTTCLKAMAFTIVNRSRYSSTNHNYPLLSSNPNGLIPNFELELYVNNNNPDLTKYVPPRIFSTHVTETFLPKSIKISECKMVYMCRNPKDVLVSLWHFKNKLRPNGIDPILLEDTFLEFSSGVTMYGPFWDHVLGYWKKSMEMPERVLFFKYEGIKREPIAHLTRLAEFLGYPFSAEEEENGVVDEIFKLCSFENMSNLEVNKTREAPTGVPHDAFFRRGEVGDWEKYLSSEMVDEIDNITENKFDGFGLKF